MKASYESDDGTELEIITVDESIFITHKFGQFEPIGFHVGPDSARFLASVLNQFADESEAVYKEIYGQ